MKILVIEDEPALNQSMVDYLSEQRYLVEAATDYRSALQKIENYDYDCIVLDIMLPGGSGLTLLEALRNEKKEDGVIIISARDQLDDKINGLKLGADDYLTKPFHLPELAMRIAAIVRRKSLHGSNKVTFEEIELDVQAKSVTVNGANIVMTKKEYELLLYFIINKNRVLSKSTIIEHLWGDDMDLVDNYDFLYAHIKNLRKKMVQQGAGDYIQSIYGMGYKFCIS